jgi:hypothetical protein
MTNNSHHTRTIVVRPSEAWRSRPRLFAALEEALDVRFVPADESSAGDAVAAIGFGAGDVSADLPTIVLPAEAVAPAGADDVDVRFAVDTRIDEALRGASLRHHALLLEDLSSSAEATLASVGRAPVWARAGSVERVAVGIAELGLSEPLRNRLTSGSFLPLLPLVDFLRRVAPPLFTTAPLRASFLFDDPNLHSRSYGYLDYEALVADARSIGYHVGFATIPLDTWYASRAAVELFRSHGDVLSLVTHGNDHVRRELAQPMEDGARRALLTQGLRRIERFERRHGVHVARVMVPPHGACSQETAAEMPLVGYEALCVSRPYPWLGAPPPERALAGWHSTEIVTTGLPVIPRLHLNADRGEIVLRAFLRQPIVLYGHHGDVREGLGVLRDAAAQVDSVGGVQWMSLGEIATSSSESRVDGARLHLRLNTRRSVVEVTDDVSELIVELSPYWPAQRIRVNGREVTEFPVPVERGETLEVLVEPRQIPDNDAGRRARPRVWPYLRRGLSETRDRLLPVVSRR